MARTTSALVQGIIEADANVSLTPFIDTANQLVTDLCITSSYSDAKLELIERWLAAHFYAIRDMRSTDEMLGSAKNKYQSKVDLGLKVTHYGQQAMLLDTAGNLAGLTERTNEGVRKAAVLWLGKTKEEADLTE